MNDYLITYRIGEGTKERTHPIKGAENKSDASFRFQNEAPENSIVISIVPITEPEEIKQSNLVSRRMIINNSFDKFILDLLQQKNKTNNDLIEHIGMSKSTWKKLRNNPENLYYYDLVRISEFLDITMADLIDEISKVVKENQQSGNFDAVRFRK